jgi:putative flippase GtrA
MKRLLSKLGIRDWDSFRGFATQFLKFGLVGFLNTLISLAVYYSFIWFDPHLYMVGNVAGWVVSVANAFYWNNRYVFVGAEGSLFKRILRTYVSYGGSFLLSTALLFVQVELMGVPKTLAPIINLVVTIPLNFLVNKFWTFRSKK